MLKQFIMAVAFALTAATTWAQCAIVTGDDVRLRSTNSTSGKIVKELETGAVGTVVKIDDKLVNSSSSSDEPCDQAHWVQIRLQDGTEGWVFGQYIQTFEINKHHGIYTVDGVDYSLHVGKYMARPFDDYMCTEIELPFLVAKNNPLAGGSFLLNKTTIRQDQTGYGELADMNVYKKYWALYGSDGIGQSIGNESVMSMGKLLVDMTSYGQDSYKSLTVVEISKDSYGRFIAKGISYQDLSGN